MNANVLKKLILDGLELWIDVELCRIHLRFLVAFSCRLPAGGFEAVC